MHWSNSGASRKCESRANKITSKLCSAQTRSMGVVPGIRTTVRRRRYVLYVRSTRLQEYSRYSLLFRTRTAADLELRGTHLSSSYRKVAWYPTADAIRRNKPDSSEPYLKKNKHSGKENARSINCKF